MHKRGTHSLQVQLFHILFPSLMFTYVTSDLTCCTFLKPRKQQCWFSCGLVCNAMYPSALQSIHFLRWKDGPAQCNLWCFLQANIGAIHYFISFSSVLPSYVPSHALFDFTPQFYRQGQAPRHGAYTEGAGLSNLLRISPELCRKSHSDDSLSSRRCTEHCRTELFVTLFLWS